MKILHRGNADETESHRGSTNKEKRDRWNMKKYSEKPKKDFFYVLRLQIDHPFLEKDAISEKIGLRPKYAFYYEENEKKILRWNFSSWTKNESDFFDETRYFLRWLQDKKDFFLHLNLTGGRSTVVASLPGKINISDTLPNEALQIACMLKIKLALEVYPRLYT